MKTSVASLVVAIDIKSFNIAHFAADVHEWHGLEHLYNQDMTFRSGRAARLQSRLAVKYGRLAQVMRPDNEFDLKGIENHPDVTTQIEDISEYRY